MPATQFIQIEEFIDALTYMNQRPEWRNYMEVLVLDGRIGEKRRRRAGARRRARTGRLSR